MKKRKQKQGRRFIALIVLGILTGLGLLIFSVWRLSPYRENAVVISEASKTSEKNGDFANSQFNIPGGTDNNQSIDEYFSNNSRSLNRLHLAVFYLAVFLLSSSLTTGLIFRWRRRRSSGELYRQARIAWRQGILLGLLAVALLLLQSQRWLIWWDVLLVIGFFLLVDLWLTVRDQS